ANIFYLSGYNAWSFYTPQVLFVPASGEPLLAMREMDALGAHRTAYRFASPALGYPETLVHKPDVHPMEWVAQQLRDRGFAEGGTKTVGFEGDAHFFAVRSYLAVKNILPEWDLQDSKELVNRVRLVKSDFEIGQMRKAGRVASAAMAAAIEALEPGRPVNEVAAEVMAAQARGADGIDGDYPAIVPMFLQGEGADTPHLTWTDAVVGESEAISIELAGAYQRYHAPLARTVSLGRTGADLERLAAITVEGLEAALAHMKVGNRPSDVTAAWDAVLRRNDLEKKSRLGYSIGIGFPPDWGERTVSIRADDTTVLEENMTFHVIAGMWMTGYGFEASESVRVTPTGAELFTSAPRELIHKPRKGS
ncbi:MAG TPA: Xaa-Pro peptidase family protein, partial [Pontimonas sp.]|nr:Xaa-Pro peptidase family protein [Pontimonas sp.]